MDSNRDERFNQFKPKKNYLTPAFSMKTLPKIAFINLDGFDNCINLNLLKEYSYTLLYITLFDDNLFIQNNRNNNTNMKNIENYSFYQNFV